MPIFSLDRVQHIDLNTGLSKATQFLIMPIASRDAVHIIQLNLLLSRTDYDRESFI